MSGWPMVGCSLRGPLAAGLIVASFGGGLWAQTTRDRWFGALATDRDVRYLTSGESAKRLALSFDALLADIYWIRTLQYFGGQRLFSEHKTYDLLYPLLDMATTLDPAFTIAYRFGAHFLAEPPPGGPGRPDQAIALLEKGMAANPGRWEYLHDIAFVHYWWFRDYTTASAWFRKASKLPDAPHWMAPLAAAVLVHGRYLEEARTVWTRILETAEHEWIRRSARRALAQLDALAIIARLQDIVAEYVERERRQPRDWTDLVRAGYLTRVPVDPAGMVYALDPETGRVGVLRTSPLFPLPSALVAGPAPPR